MAATPQSDLFDQVRDALRNGDAATAASLCDQAIKQYPGDVNFLCLGARAQMVLRKFDVAKQLLNDAVRQSPEFPMAHDTLGDLLLAQGYATEAVNAWEQVLRLDPTLVHVLPKIEKAESIRAAGNQPDVASDGSQSRGRRLAFAEEIRDAERQIESGESEPAEQALRAILKRDPNHVEGARLLARIAADKKAYRDAEIMLKHAAKNAPDYARVWVDLCVALREQSKFDEALESARRVLALAPDMPESHLLEAGVLGVMGDQEGAIEGYEAALELAPERPGALISLAHQQKTIGRQDEAIANYRRSIAVKPSHAEAYWSLANLKTFQFESHEIEAMQDLLSGDAIDDAARVQLHNALGLDFESRGDFDTAFTHFRDCNVLRRESESYDPVETESRYDNVVELFDSEFFEQHTGAGCTDASPIFVVGLPRSGSTLIEQILASHSSVDGTHELHDLAHVIQAISAPRRRKEQFPASVAQLKTGGWAKIGDEYIAATQKFRGDAAFFVDKNPNNFIFVGLLKLALPNAKIINARRHPLDSCFGSYKQLFAAGQPFTYDLTEVGEYYLQYQRLMEHWHDMIPGYVLDVHYEDNVANLEEQVRRMLDFCNLPFESGCLEFHKTDRAVKTASSEQVRRPIYSSSVNLWRRYESHLGELIEVLEPLLRDLPEVDRPMSL